MNALRFRLPVTRPERIFGTTITWVRTSSIIQRSPSGDRKSTRLNSSHEWISYAVFLRYIHSFPTRRSSDLGSGDPVVLYDQLADRWVISQFAGVSVPTDECIAVSTTGDATGTYFRYDYHLGSNFFDYPKVAVWRSEEHTSELQSRVDLVCRLPPLYTLFPYTTLFRSR